MRTSAHYPDADARLSASISSAIVMQSHQNDANYQCARKIRTEKREQLNNKIVIDRSHTHSEWKTRNNVSYWLAEREIEWQRAGEVGDANKSIARRTAWIKAAHFVFVCFFNKVGGKIPDDEDRQRKKNQNKRAHKMCRGYQLWQQCEHSLRSLPHHSRHNEFSSSPAFGARVRHTVHSSTFDANWVRENCTRIHNNGPA